MKEQILDRLARLLKYFKGLEHENNEKEYAYILKGTIRRRNSRYYRRSLLGR